MNRQRGFLFACALCFSGVALAVFYEGLHAPWYYDSALLPDNAQVFAGKGLWGVIDLFPQRPVPMASFYVNYLLAGMEPFWFRAVNVALLGLTATGVTAVMLLLLDTPALAVRGTDTEKTALAVLFGLLFLVHPVQTYLVLYVWQRMALLACCCFVGAFAVYLGVRTSRIKPPVAGYVLSMVLFAAAVLSKENAATLPVVLILAELAFFKESKRAVFVRAVMCAACLMGLVAVLSLLERPHGTDAQSAGIVNTLAKYYQESGLSFKELFITQCRLLFAYVSTVLYPVPSRVLLVSPQVIYGTLWDSPATMAAAAAACALPFVALYLMRKRPLTGFGILFFFINLLPEAFLVPQYLFFAYRASLPMVGLFLIVLDGMFALLERQREHEVRSRALKAIMAVMCGAIVMVAWGSLCKAALWADQVGLWTEVVQHMPRDGERIEKRSSVNAFNNLGIALQRQGNASEATRFHRLAAAADPSDARSLVLLAKAYIRDRRFSEAQEAIHEALAISPENAEAHMGLAVVFLEQNRLTEAATHAKRALALDPRKARHHNDLGVILLKRGEYGGAAAHFARATELNPGFMLAHYQWAKALWADGKLEQAVEQFKRTLELKPDHPRARTEFAAILAYTGHVHEAVSQLSAQLDAYPNDTVAKAHLNRLVGQLNTLEHRNK